MLPGLLQQVLLRALKKRREERVKWLEDEALATAAGASFEGLNETIICL